MNDNGSIEAPTRGRAALHLSLTLALAVAVTLGAGVVALTLSGADVESVTALRIAAGAAFGVVIALSVGLWVTDRT